MNRSEPVTGKAHIQDVLRRLGLYHRTKMSRLYDLYWLVADRRIIDDREAEVRFYRRHLVGLPPNGLIFDVGANLGYKTGIFLRLGARVVAIDPDEHNQNALHQGFVRWRRRPRVTVVGQAVSDADATATLWVTAPGAGVNTLSRKWVDVLGADTQRFGAFVVYRDGRNVTTTTLARLMETYGEPFFIKIDVEGHEPSVIRGLRQRVPYLQFEVNLPEFRREGAECVELLAGLAPAGRFAYTADCRMADMLVWRDKGEFLDHLARITNPSIEIFWRSS
jgi:FkbM family methyltransferase